MHTAYIVVDLQFGDACKGATVDYLGHEISQQCSGSKMLGVRYSGGYQSVHNVVLPDGRHHAYRQWSAATHWGASTYIGREFIFCPVSASIEKQALIKLGMLSAGMIFSHPQSLVATPYHRVMNIASNASHHGTTRCGIGATRKYWLDHGGDAIFSGDLRYASGLEDKIRLLWHRTRLHLSNSLLTPDEEEEISWLMDRNPIKKVVQDLRHAGASCWVSSEMPKCDVAIYEGSQGILLDEYHGFHPNTTWSDLTTRCAVETIPDGVRTKTVGCIRAFTTRHGAGPLPSESSDLKARMSEPHNVGGSPGEFRWGYLDMDLLRYAVKCQPVDCLAVSWLDKFADPRSGLGMFATSRDDEPLVSSTVPQLGRNREAVRRDKRILTQIGEAELLRMLDSVAPVGIEGRGPTHLDRISRSIK
jgi:adenylosuccinate synthase